MVNCLVLTAKRKRQTQIPVPRPLTATALAKAAGVVISLEAVTLTIQKKDLEAVTLTGQNQSALLQAHQSCQTAVSLKNHCQRALLQVLHRVHQHRAALKNHRQKALLQVLVHHRRAAVNFITCNITTSGNIKKNIYLEASTI